MDLQKLRAANVARQAEWGGNEQADLEFRALEVADETGELCGAVKKLVRAQRGITGSTLSVGDVADEMGDVLISIDLLASQLDLALPWPGMTGSGGTASEINMALRLDAVVGDLSDAVIAHIADLETTSSTGQQDLGDIWESMRRAIFWVAQLAARLSIDLGQAVAAKFNKTSIKYGLRTTMPETAAA
ncbi:MazG-like family protein [Pseudophaeobacter sp. C1-32P7]|uniref:MazG-like family protein n=1 Tax=Pseudophaeobacter sp. C1-32P7 TaxID=3098142 RepID=UPI0034D406A7